MGIGGNILLNIKRKKRWRAVGDKDTNLWMVTVAVLERRGTLIESDGSCFGEFCPGGLPP